MRAYIGKKQLKRAERVSDDWIFFSILILISREAKKPSHASGVNDSHQFPSSILRVKKASEIENERKRKIREFFPFFKSGSNTSTLAAIPTYSLSLFVFIQSRRPLRRLG